MRSSQGGYLFPCTPEINWLVPLFPKNRKKKCFLMFPVPQYCLCSPVPLKIWHLFPCSPEINTLFPLFPKTPGRASSIASSRPTQSVLLYLPAGGILAILTVSGPPSACCQSKGEFQICPRIDLNNILYVEYLQYNNYKNEIILFLERC